MRRVAAESREHSYYAASVSGPTPGPPLTGATRCDVCVIGAGLTGLSAALELAARGFEVLVLEAGAIGDGASGRSGGQLIFGYACEMTKLAALVPATDARRLWDFSCAALADVRARVADYAIDCDWVDGQIHVAIKARQRAELRAWQAVLAEDYGYDGLEFLDGEALSAHVVSPRYCAGLYDPRGAHVHPLKYTLGLAAAARAAGVQIYEHSRVLSLRRGARPAVSTAHGCVECRYVAIAGGAYLGSLVPELARRIMPVSTYIVATAPLGAELAARCLPSNAAVADLNFVLEYFRRSADDRLLFGGRASYSKRTPPNLAESLRRRMSRVFPQLASIPIEYAWGGYVDVTWNRAPDFGRLDDTLYYAQGFSGHGMAISGLAGKVLAEALAGDAMRFDVFARIPHRAFVGGRWLQTPCWVLASLYHRLRDCL